MISFVEHLILEFLTWKEEKTTWRVTTPDLHAKMLHVPDEAHAAGISGFGFQASQA